MEHSLIGASSIEGRWSSVGGRPFQLILHIFLVLVAANGMFLAVRFAGTLVPKTIVQSALIEGYANQAITIEPNPSNMLMGWDQGSDCTAAQLALLGGVDPVRDAIAPRLLTKPQVGEGLRVKPAYVCRDLKRYLDGKINGIPDITYTRFWQGGASALTFALTILPFDGYRALLLNLTLGLIALAAVLAGLAGRPMLVALSPLLLVSFLVSGQIGYAQLVSHGPAHVALWVFAITIIARHDRLTVRALLPLAVLAGAAEAFFDQIISVPLIAGSFLIVAGIVIETSQPSSSVRSAILRNLFVAGAWGFGFLGSYGVKLLLSVALLGSEQYQEFVNQLAFRVGMVDPDLGLTAGASVSRLGMLWINLVQLSFNLWRLGYGGSQSAQFIAMTIVPLSLYGWFKASRQWAIRKPDQRTAIFISGVPYLLSAAIVLLWFIAMPEHTYRHAFMVRSYALILIGGWGWFFTARYAAGQGRAGEAGRSESIDPVP